MNTITTHTHGTTKRERKIKKKMTIYMHGSSLFDSFKLVLIRMLMIGKFQRIWIKHTPFRSLRPHQHLRRGDKHYTITIVCMLSTFGTYNLSPFAIDIRVGTH